ncbi:hypothetical protein MRX96_016562 [Rhipicephalus microplus]
MSSLLGGTGRVETNPSEAIFLSASDTRLPNVYVCACSETEDERPRARIQLPHDVVYMQARAASVGGLVLRKKPPNVAP